MKRKPQACTRLRRLYNRRDKCVSKSRTGRDVVRCLRTSTDAFIDAYYFKKCKWATRMGRKHADNMFSTNQLLRNNRAALERIKLIPTDIDPLEIEGMPRR